MKSRTSINTDLLSTPEFLMAPPTQFGQSIPPLSLPAKHNAGFKASPPPTFKSHISDKTLRAAAAAAKVAQRTSFASGLDFGAAWPDALATAKAQPRGGLRIKAPQNDVFMRPEPTSPMSCSTIDSLEDLVPSTNPRQSSIDDDDSASGSDTASTLESKEAPIVAKTESPTHSPAPVQPPPLPARRNLRPRKPRNQALIDELKERPTSEVEEGDNVCCICVNTLVKADTFPVPVPFKLAAGAKPYLHSPKLCNTHYNFVRRHFAIDQAKAHKKCQKVPHARCLHVLQGLAATGLQLYKPGTEPPATCSTPKRRAPRSSSSSSLGKTTSSGAPSGGMSPKVEGSQVAGFKQAASKVPRKRARSKGSNILDPTCSPLDAKPCTECPSPRVAKRWLHCELVTDDDINKAVDQLDMAVGLCDLGFDDEMFGVGSPCLGHHSGSDTKRRRFQS